MRIDLNSSVDENKTGGVCIAGSQQSWYITFSLDKLYNKRLDLRATCENIHLSVDSAGLDVQSTIIRMSFDFSFVTGFLVRIYVDNLIFFVIHLAAEKIIAQPTVKMLD